MNASELTVPLILTIGTLLLMVHCFSIFRDSGKSKRSALVPVPLQRSSSPVHPDVASEFSHHTNSSSTSTAIPESLAKYRDVEVAVEDGYRFPIGAAGQRIVQLTNHWYAFKAAFGFDAEHPTSLLYEKEVDGSYRLVGAMFTAPARFSPEQLETRIPSTLARWRRHELFGWAAEVSFLNNNEDSFHAA